MRLKVISILVLFFTYHLGLSQNIIKVRPKHHKELIYTLKEGEHILQRNESSIDMSLSGTDYMFRTSLNRTSYEHKRGRATKEIELNYKHPMIFNGAEICCEKGKYFVKNTRTGRKKGPYLVVLSPGFDFNKFQVKDKGYGDFDLRTTKSELFGFVYGELKENEALENAKINKKSTVNYFVKKQGENAKGPYIFAEIYYASKSSFIYSYKTEEGNYLSKNDTLFGPFEDLYFYKSRYTAWNRLPSNDMFCYKLNGVWHIENESHREYTFVRKPHIYRSSLGSYFQGAPREKNNIIYHFYSSGYVVENSLNNFKVYNSKKDTLRFQSIENYSKYHKKMKYEMFFHQKKIGVFYAEALMGYHHNFKSDIFPATLISADSSMNEGRKNEFFFSASQGLLGPFSHNESRNLKFFNSSYAFVNRNDSTLIVDGEVIDEKVIAVNYSQSPENWWMIKQEGDYYISYKNGIRSSSKKMPSALNWSYKKSPNKPFIIVQRGEKYYIKRKTDKQLLGPVQLRSEIALSSDQKNYAECSRRDQIILINGKAISKGFNVVYNKDLDAFHWFSIAKEKHIYLHTFEVN